jgi:epoxide hydrolase
MSEIVADPINISDAQLDDLKQRLAMTRWPDKETPNDWTQGIPLDYMQEVCAYWADGYDWRKCEAELNSMNPSKTTIDGLGIHFLHIRSPHDDAMPLIMSHGWPGSTIEFMKVIRPLTDPTAFGGKAEDAFHVVCPALPGFGFSDKPTEPGWTIERIGRAWGQLMARLGYDRYLAQGGDWGAIITTSMGKTETEHCAAIHLNMPLVAPDPDTMDDLTEAEKGAIKAGQYYWDWGSGYSKEQSTRPQTLGYGLADSPSGQAAWVMEKYWAWTDCKGHPENVLTRDELLDNVMMYWITDSGASSGRIYWESFNSTISGIGQSTVDMPTGCSIYPQEIFRSSRRWAEKTFTNLIHFNTMDKGGHFAAFEQPELFVNELRTCFSNVR